VPLLPGLPVRLAEASTALLHPPLLLEALQQSPVLPSTLPCRLVKRMVLQSLQLVSWAALPLPCKSWKIFDTWALADERAGELSGHLSGEEIHNTKTHIEKKHLHSRSLHA